MASRPKPVINSWEAAYLIRQGRSDLELMKRYAISAKGLESLFKKLVLVGAITQEELEQRSQYFGKTHGIDVLSDTDPRSQEKPSVSASEAQECIRSGLSDQEIMERYDISTKGLESLLRKLVARDIISQEELDARGVSQATTDVEVVHVPQLPSTLTAPPFADGIAAAPQKATRDAEEPSRSAVLPEFEPSPGIAPMPDYGAPAELKFKERFPHVLAIVRGHNIGLAATFGAIAGVVLLTTAFALIVGVDYALDSFVRFKKPKPAPVATVDPWTAEAERTQRMLKSIAEEAAKLPDGPQAEGQKVGGYRGQAYQDCLRECEKEAEGGDAADRVAMIYCKRDCAARFSDHARKIRQRYHQPAIQF